MEQTRPERLHLPTKLAGERLRLNVALSLAITVLATDRAVESDLGLLREALDFDPLLRPALVDDAASPATWLLRRLVAADPRVRDMIWFDDHAIVVRPQLAKALVAWMDALINARDTLQIEIETAWMKRHHVPKAINHDHRLPVISPLED